MKGQQGTLIAPITEFPNSTATNHEEKLRILGQASAMLAHEIKNPLGSMKLFVSLLREDLKINDLSVENLEGLEDGINRIDRIISQVLTFAKVQRINESLVNMHSLIHERVLEMQRLYKKTTININLTQSPFIQGDAHLIEHVLTNLLRNAVEATNAKGSIDIYDFDSSDNSYGLCVADDGPGISTEEREEIFEPFISTKTQGTGLGLALVREIVRQHGGSVTVEDSPKGTGACFRLKFPRRIPSPTN